jgi:tetratricopeptide (TPR) repeat protein
MPTDSELPHKPTSLAGGLLVLVLALGAGACSSTDEDGPTEEQRVQLYLETALRYYDLEDLDRAQDQADRGLELEPDNERLRLIKGWTLQRRGTPEAVLRAERIFRGLLSTKDYRVSLGLADSLERKGTVYDGASRKIRAGERYTDAPDPEERARELAQLAQDSWEEAIQRYEETLEQRPDERLALAGLARVTALLGRDTESLAWSDALLGDLQDAVEFWKRNLERADLTAREEDTYRALLADNIRLEIKTRLHAAVIARRMKANDIALENLNRILELDPKQTGVQSRRAQLLFEVGDYEGALAAIERFLTLSTDEFDHPDIRRAMNMRSDCEEHLAAAAKAEVDAPE